jgi:hypothetical protein
LLLLEIGLELAELQPTMVALTAALQSTPHK